MLSGFMKQIENSVKMWLFCFSVSSAVGPFYILVVILSCMLNYHLECFAIERSEKLGLMFIGGRHWNAWCFKCLLDVTWLICWLPPFLRNEDVSGKTNFVSIGWLIYQHWAMCFWVLHLAEICFLSLNRDVSLDNVIRLLFGFLFLWR